MWFYKEGTKIDEQAQLEMMKKLIEEAKKRKSATLNKVLLLPPDKTRYYSGSGKLTNMLYHILMDRGLIPYEREGNKYVAYCPHCAVGGKYANTAGLKNAVEVFGDKLRDDIAMLNYQNYNGATADHEKEIDKNRHFCSGAVECEQEELCK